MAPRAGYPVVVPRYRPRPLVRAAAGAAVIRRAPVVGTVVPSQPIVATDLGTVPAKEFTQSPAYQVASVADDYTLTVSIDGKPTPVRLLGVEPLLVAPAEGQPGVLPEEARHFVRHLLVGESVYLEHDPGLATSDAEGTLVAYVHRAPDGLLMNLEIIRRGFGLAAEGYSFEHQDVFASYQKWAQANGKGIWATVAGSPAGN